MAKKKALAAASENGLACEVCGFHFGHCYGKLGEGFIECHHLRPLADTGPTRTRPTTSPSCAPTVTAWLTTVGRGRRWMTSGRHWYRRA